MVRAEQVVKDNLPIEWGLSVVRVGPSKIDIRQTSSRLAVLHRLPEGWQPVSFDNPEEWVYEGQPERHVRKATVNLVNYIKGVNL